MELLAMDMKLRGIYMARQLSFKEIIFENRNVKISTQFQQIYDQSVALVINLLYIFIYYVFNFT